MTIQDAIKSKRPFRRSTWKPWLVLGIYGNSFREEGYKWYEGEIILCTDDILALDWETKQAAEIA